MTAKRSNCTPIMLDAVVLAVVDEALMVLVDSRRGALPALPGGPFEADTDETLESALRARVQSCAGLVLDGVEQLGANVDLRLPPDSRSGAARTLSIAWLALVRPDAPAEPGLSFAPVYEFLPWEDRRSGRTTLADRHLAAALRAWGGNDRRRSAAVARLFGCDGAPWPTAAAAERYELLREAGVAVEPVEAAALARMAALGDVGGRQLAGTQRLSLALALDRLRRRLRGVPQVQPLMPGEFTLLTLQRAVEASGGTRLHKQNFRRLVETAGLVTGTGRHATRGRGRPAELYRFAP
jgi:hypothetical protein